MTRLSLAFTYHDLPLGKVRKLLGENVLDAYPRLDAAALHKVAERVQRREPRMGPLPVSFQVEHCCYRWRPGACVNADGQINVHRRVVHREEIGIVQSVVAFDTAEENAHGAVCLSGCDFFH